MVLYLVAFDVIVVMHGVMGLLLIKLENSTLAGQLRESRLHGRRQGGYQGVPR